MKIDRVCKFTVIVPVFNKEKYVVRCLDSLKNQSLTEFEIICVDDGSTDSSNKFVRECMTRDPRILLLENEENRGVSYSRNYAITHAKGRYILFLDSDDYLEADTLKQYYDEMNRQNADMLFFNFIIRQESRHRLNCDEGIQGIYPKVYNGQELLGSFAKNDEFFLYACMVAYNREFVIRNHLKFIDLKCGEGGEFILAALLVAEKVVVSQYKGYVYCLNDYSVNTETGIEQEALYGQVVQYIHMLQSASQNPGAKNICTFLNWFRGKIMGGIANLSEEAVLLFDQRMENEYSRHIWSLLTHTMECAEELLSEDDLKLLKKEHAVLLYGAGRETLETLKLINRLHIEVLGIIVTQKKGNPDILYGYRVQDIKSLCEYDPNTLILITAHSKHHRMIITELKARGFHKNISVKRR